jgi:inorganic pyrophosphatase
MSETPFICMVEIPMGSRNKYEFDPKLGVIAHERHRARVSS